MRMTESEMAIMLSFFILSELPTAISGPPTTVAPTCGNEACICLIDSCKMLSKMVLCSVSLFPNGELTMAMARLMSGVKIYPSYISKIFCPLER